MNPSRSRLPVCLLFAAVAGPSGYAQTWTGPTPNDRYGISVSIIGDIDNPMDGIREVLVGAPGQVGTINGAAYVQRVGVAGAVRTHVGFSNQDLFGEFVGRVGDLDNDGFTDYAVGAPNRNLGVGSVFLFSGASGALLQIINGPAGSQWFGFRVVSVGDLNGDSKADIAIAAVGVSVRGQVGIFLSTPTTHVAAPFPPLVGSPAASQVDQFGHGLVFLGGGSNTLAVGAPQLLLNPSQTFAGGVFRFNLSATAATPLPLIARSIAFERFGTSVAAVGDLNGDGTQDVGVGIPFAGTNGLIGFFSGATTGQLSLFTATTGVRNGHWLATIGDVDSDNLADVIAGSIAGPFHVLSGAAGTLIRTISGPPGFGGPVDAGPDLLGNGGSDILAGHFATGTGNAQIVPLSESTWVGTGCTALSPPPPVPRLTASARPTLGTTTTMTAQSFYTGTVVGSMLIDNGPPTPTPIGPCTWFLTPAALTLVTLNVNHPPGTFAVPIAIPNNPAFVGAGLVVQAAYLPSGVIDMSNAIVLRLGTL